MDFGFPTSPKFGDKVTFGSTEWTFTGSDWIKGAEQRRGRAGATGATGATGPAGATGPVEEFVASINGLTGAITTEGLTFAFAGISVGASGITVDGDIRLVSGAIGFTTDVNIFVGEQNVNLARFSRTNTKVTLGDINGDSSANPTFFELDTKNKLVSVTGGVFFAANGVSLGVGLTFPDGTFQSSAHAPHDFVSSFNGATGAIEGVNSFNGLTGAISTTTLTLEVAGISTEGAITAEGGIALIGNVSSSKNLKIGIPGSGLGGGPFVPNTYSFPNNKLAALDSGNNPSILVNRSTISAFEGNTELEFKRIGDFVVKSFNSVTGDVEGVNSFNGLTGAVSTTALTLQVAGISSSGDITSHGGTLEANNFVVDGGKIFQKGNEATTHIDMSSAQDVLIKAADDITIQASDDVNITATDNVKLTHGNASSDTVIIDTGATESRLSTANGKFITVSDDMATISFGDLSETSGSAKIQVTDAGISFVDAAGTQREFINDNYRRNTDVATFTIDASSAIATGAKTNSMYRIPYNATLKNFDVKLNGTGGFTAAIYIAGTDFGTPLTGRITGCSLGTTGATGSSTVFNQAAITAGNYLFLDVFTNASGSSAAQAFLTFESR